MISYVGWPDIKMTVYTFLADSVMRMHEDLGFNMLHTLSQHYCPLRAALPRAVGSYLFKIFRTDICPLPVDLKEGYRTRLADVSFTEHKYTSIGLSILALIFVVGLIHGADQLRATLREAIARIFGCLQAVGRVVNESWHRLGAGLSYCIRMMIVYIERTLNLIAVWTTGPTYSSSQRLYGTTSGSAKQTESRAKASQRGATGHSVTPGMAPRRSTRHPFPDGATAETSIGPRRSHASIGRRCCQRLCLITAAVLRKR